MSSMEVVWNEEEDLDKAVWVNQVVLFLQSFSFTIDLLACQANNIKLCRSRRYCSFLNPFWVIIPFYALLKTSKIRGFLMFSRGMKN